MTRYQTIACITVAIINIASLVVIDVDDATRAGQGEGT